MNSEEMRRIFTSMSLKLPNQERLCLSDKGLLKKVLKNYQGRIEKESDIRVIVSANFESLNDPKGFLTILSREFLLHSNNLGIYNYLYFSNKSHPEFLPRKAVILDSYKHSKKLGDRFYKILLNKFEKEGCRIIRTIVGLDYILGFEEVLGAVHSLDRFTDLLDYDVCKISPTIDFSEIQYFNY